MKINLNATVPMYRPVNCNWIGINESLGDNFRVVDTSD